MRRKNFAAAFFAGILTVTLLGIGAVVVWFAINWVRGSMAMPGVVPGLPSSVGPSENVTYESGAIVPNWSGTERVTVLALGIDEREQEEGPWRTDTIMVLTLDPVAKQGGVLSIPRDLWVPIPGYKDGRINTAHFLGDLYGYPGGGPALARDTVEYNLGEPIHYYARINFQGFVELVNLIGGVDIYVDETINDPTYPDYNYGYDPLYIEAGFHHFDGEMALKYARTRHGSSDFDRARRQQQVMLAVLDRVTSMEMLPTLAKNMPKLYDIMQASVQTDLALDQILALANVTTQVEHTNIRFGVIDQTSTQPWVTPDGAQVLVPIREKMREVRDYIFTATLPTPTVTLPQVTQSLPEQELPPTAIPTVTPDTTTVAVLNGTPQGGLASTTAEYLKSNGVNVIQVGNATRQDYANTMIVMYRDQPTTAARLAGLLNLSTSVIVSGNDPNAAQDIVIILGVDYKQP
ncbi:MAG: LCP family protein [Anaerolineae bacterium]|nr:LCP family protein [Anaerolineae bacterium]